MIEWWYSSPSGQEYHRLIIWYSPVPSKLIPASALAACTLIALALQGSRQHSGPLNLTHTFPDPGITALNFDGQQLSTLGRYLDARNSFFWAARIGDAIGNHRASAINRNNAGAVELVTQQYSEALKNFTEARRIAEAHGQAIPFLMSMNNLANLYIATGQPENALRVAREALDGTSGNSSRDLRAKLLCQVSIALAEMHQFEEAAPVEREAVKRLIDLNQLDDLARLLAAMATYYIPAGRLEDADRVLNQGMALIHDHQVKATAGILLGRANLAGKRGETGEAKKLFQAALDVREDRTPRWKILADRGRFRLETNQDEDALSDFREAGALVSQIRADMVPADQDRVAFETGIGQYLRGVVEAGNRVALRTGNTELMAETFDAAERNRLWSLRALLPGSNDWRSRLPAAYWEKLARYQVIQRRALTISDAPLNPEAETLKLALQQMEGAAGGQGRPGAQATGRSPVRYAQSLLDPATVLFSFHISADSSWVWAVSRNAASVFRLPPEAELRKSADDFIRSGMTTDAGRRLYTQLFGSIPAHFIHHSKWLLEPDGPLHDVPFAALVAELKAGTPIYLVERASLQIIPGVLLLEKRPFRADGTFLGIGDPVYNAADPRFPGDRGHSEFSLPRLPKTARELEVSAKSWGAGQVHLLTGMNASAESLWKLSATNPSVIHFATHVVTGNGEYRSGLIALRLNPQGAMELLGPREILARTISADLVVMNGCHSAQGEAVPSSGRMGLTRAWIGAGAGGVLATQWDISDDDAEALMSNFYILLKTSPELGVAEALRQAQLSALRSSRRELTRWAGYYLLSRTF